jgi:hypothetical protein
VTLPTPGAPRNRLGRGRKAVCGSMRPESQTLPWSLTEDCTAIVQRDWHYRIGNDLKHSQIDPELTGGRLARKWMARNDLRNGPSRPFDCVPR